MLTIDGSIGEGGGQILRTALALSMITAIPFRIDKIRAKRAKPGLLRQHLTCVKAAEAISKAKTEGAELGSKFLAFQPGPLTGGEHRFAIGSAGSTTLVAQTIMPALCFAPAPSRVMISGGTHNQSSPPFPFLDIAFLPLVRRIGFDVAAIAQPARLLSRRWRRDRDCGFARSNFQAADPRPARQRDRPPSGSGSSPTSPTRSRSGRWQPRSASSKPSRRRAGR